jgi:hypothetical protein
MGWRERGYARFGKKEWNAYTGMATRPCALGLPVADEKQDPFRKHD